MIKRLIFCFTVVLGAYSLGFSQKVSPERNYYYLQQVEKNIFQLPVTFEHLQTVIIPEIHRQRFYLAPHYPSRADLPRDVAVVNQAFLDWIINYPSEHETYLNYLKVYYRTHK